MPAIGQVREQVLHWKIRLPHAVQRGPKSARKAVNKVSLPGDGCSRRDYGVEFVPAARTGKQWPRESPTKNTTVRAAGRSDLRVDEDNRWSGSRQRRYASRQRTRLHHYEDRHPRRLLQVAYGATAVQNVERSNRCGREGS